MVLENMQASSMSHNLTLEDLSRRIIGDRSFACKKVNPSKTSVEDRIISGTYCHPDLIPHIACWVSADFAGCYIFKMSQEASSEPMPTEVIVPRNPCEKINNLFLVT